MIRGLMAGTILGGATAVAALAVVSTVILPPPPPASGGAVAVAARPPGGDDRPAEANADAARPVAARPVPAPAPLPPPAPAAEPVLRVEPPRPDADPRPPVPETGIVEVPAGSEFGRGRADREPVAPEAADPAPDIGAADPVAQPAADPSPVPAERESAAVPAVAPVPDAPGLPQAVAPVTTAPAAEMPVTAAAAAPPPDAPERPAAPVIAGGTAPSPGAVAGARAEAPEAMVTAPVVSAPGPDASAAPAGPEPSSPATSAVTVADVERPRVLPQIDPGTGAEMAPSVGSADPGRPPQVTDLSPALPVVPDAPQPGFALAEGVRVNRLPQLGVETGDAATDVPSLASGALDRHAVDFTPLDDRALLGLLLIPPASAPLPPVAALLDRGLPATVALDPRAADAAATMSALRAAGRDVAILAAGLPEGALPRDLEVNFATWADRLPEAALIVEAPEPGFQNDRMLATQMVTIAGAGGYGLVTHRIGLNSAGQLAAGAGLPRAESFAILGAAGETASALRRTLDRAGFEAGRSGRVLLVAEARPDVLDAIAAWLEARPDMAAAPATAVLDGRGR